MDKLQLKVEIRHKSNWHNETVRACRRSKFMCALVLALRKVPIYGPGGGGEPLGGASNPSYSVTVPDTFAVNARDKASADKEAKRLVPTPKKEDEAKSSDTDLGTATEKDAAESLNRRRPTEDSGAPLWSSTRDDHTLNDNARDSSLERHRSDDINDLRQGLLKRESTRGRRRPGESVPPMPNQSGYSGIGVTASSPINATNQGFMASATQVLDEESELAMHYQPQQQQGGYSIYPAVSAQSQSQFPGGVGSGQGNNLYSGSSAPSGQPQSNTLRRLSLGFKPQRQGSLGSRLGS